MTRSEITVYLWAAGSSVDGMVARIGAMEDGQPAEVLLPSRVFEARNNLGGVLFNYWALRGARELHGRTLPDSWFDQLPVTDG